MQGSLGFPNFDQLATMAKAKADLANGKYYNALSSYKDENGSIVRPHNKNYDIKKLIGDVKFSTDYDAVMQIYQSKNPVTTK